MKPTNGRTLDDLKNHCAALFSIDLKLDITLGRALFPKSTFSPMSLRKSFSKK